MSRKYIRVADFHGYAQIKRRERDGTNQSFVSRIRFVSSPSEFATVIDMRPEYDARRRERLLSKELEAIDALWLERSKAITKTLRQGIRAN